MATGKTSTPPTAPDRTPRPAPVGTGFLPVLPQRVPGWTAGRKPMPPLSGPSTSSVSRLPACQATAAENTAIDATPLAAHGTHPLLRKRGCFQEPTSAFDLRQRSCDGVRDRETQLKTRLRHVLHRTRLNRKAGHRRDLQKGRYTNRARPRDTQPDEQWP